MKYAEIKNLNKDELRKKLRQLNQDVFEAQMKLSMQRLPDPLTLRRLRKDRARIHTALHQQPYTEKKQ